jgi:hypothetical protein
MIFHPFFVIGLITVAIQEDKSEPKLFAHEINPHVLYERSMRNTINLQP